MQDSIIQLFPWRHFVFQSLTSGIIPFWNPYQQLGAPFMANIKPLVFYPFNFFFIFGEVTAWHLLLASQLFFGMLFAYLLAREFKLSVLPSILVAFSFGLNSFMIGLLEFGSDGQTLLWWPLIILFSKKYLDSYKRKYLLFVALSVALGILGGQLQYMGYFFIFLVGFILYYGKHTKTSFASFVLLFGSIGLGIGLTAFQLLPSVELFKYSHRGLLSQAQQHTSFSSGLMTPDKLLRLFAPDFFGNPVTHDAKIGYIEGSGYFGSIALFFAVFALVFARKETLVKFLSAVFLIALLLSLQGIGEIPYLLKLPLITSGSAGRVFTLVLFSGSLLAGYGLTEFINLKNRKKQAISVGIFLAFFVSAVAGSWIFHIFDSKTNLLQSLKFAFIILGLFALATIIYLSFLSKEKTHKYLQKSFIIILLFLSFFDLFRMGYRFLTFSNPKFLYPHMQITQYIQDHSKTSLSRVYGLTEPEIGTYLGVYTIETYNPLYLLRTIELLQSLQNLPPHDLSVDNKYFLMRKENTLKYTLDVLGTDYIVINKDQNPATTYFQSVNVEKQLTKVYTDEKYSIYKNNTSYPRFGLFYDAIIIPHDTDALATLSQHKIDLTKKILLQEKLPRELHVGTGSATLVSSNINSQTFKITTTTPALFYLSDTWYPGWKATINNKETKIYQANYALRAVVVPQGESLITFTYLPGSFVWGIVVSIVSLLVLILLTKLPLAKR